MSDTALMLAQSSGMVCSQSRPNKMGPLPSTTYRVCVPMYLPNAQILQEDKTTVPMMSSNPDSTSNSVAQMEEEIDMVGRSRLQETSGSGKKCYKCGRNDHFAHDCIHKDSVCHNCNKHGHLARVCHAKGSQLHDRISTARRAQWLEQGPEASDPEEDVIFSIGSKTTLPYQVVVQINDWPITMEIDTGAAVSILSKET